MSNECYGAEAETVSRRAGGAVAWVELGTHPDASPDAPASTPSAVWKRATSRRTGMLSCESVGMLGKLSR